MAHTREQKIKLLVLYDLLCRHTDENHSLMVTVILSVMTVIRQRVLM